MTVVLLGHDLIIASRVMEAAARVHVEVRRVDDPSQLPAPDTLRLLLVAWDERLPDWGERLTAWCAGAPESAKPRILLFGPHLDLESHAAARAAGLGPVLARSRFVADLPTFLSPAG